MTDQTPTEASGIDGAASALNDGLAVTPPPMPRCLGRVRVFVPQIGDGKMCYGYNKCVDVFSREQMEERDKAWLRLIGKTANAPLEGRGAEGGASLSKR